MSLFQKTVITKYLNTQNKELISLKWESYKTHFLNPKVQEEIKSLKEEQYQGEFLEDLFVKILGYTKPASSSETPYNLTTEYKNVKDSKKADGAIIIDTKVKAVIELKGTNTTDLGKIEVQAFGYKNNQPECVYVITSNFEKLRFYIDNAIEHLEFNLFTLTQEEFSLLYLCLGYENIANDVAKKIKEESLSEEDVITKKLYKDYSIFKRELYQSLVALNPAYEPLELFKKSQKLLDRFLFLLFGEDRNLLPPNSVKLILSQWNQLRELDEYTPLYDRFKKYFGYLNTGYKGKQYDVFAYNGGLFKPDTILDSIIIDDDLLYKHTLKLSEYDFASEVDVNILGHIFENSLNELDEIKAQLEGAEIDKSKTKRKKDGVFYTPKYITKYIVENTVGKLCTEKKAEIEIIEEDYFTDKKRQKKTIKGLIDKLEEYRKWLLQITIIDPACGSGAFLNEALNFLIAEHTYVDELQAKLFGDAMVLSDVEKSILENNLFGVDLNEESVEIAKLSLWLRTAQPNRKLNDLSSNIKCGNSLIDDPEIAGEKAFNWQNEFPKVFEKGGFDVVIGNPPYGAKVSKIDLKYFVENYKEGGLNNIFSDTYISFYILGLSKLLKENGLLGYIAPNTWRLVGNGSEFRNFITSNKFSIQKIIQHTEKVFIDATVDVDTLIISNSISSLKVNIIIGDVNKSPIQHHIYQSTLNKQQFINLFLTDLIYELKSKIENKSDLAKDLFEVKNGVKPYEVGKGKPAQTREVLDLKPYTSETKIDETFTPLIGGSSFNKYQLLWNNDYWIKYGEWLAAPRSKDIFEAKEKLIFRQTSDKIIGMHVSDGFVMRDNTHILLSKNDVEIDLKFTLSILNSKLINYYYQLINPEKGEVLAQVKLFHLANLPVKNISLKEQQPFIEKADQMLSLNKVLQDQSQKYQRTIQRKFELEVLPKKLQDWYKLTYLEFIKELAKKKVKLSLSQEAEWEDYFMQESKIALELKSQIDATDKAIDTMVYELYGLSKEEIEIVEKG
jgi:type I restriction-modification system DNA methylase subunit